MKIAKSAEQHNHDCLVALIQLTVYQMSFFFLLNVGCSTGVKYGCRDPGGGSRDSFLLVQISISALS